MAIVSQSCFRRSFVMLDTDAGGEDLANSLQTCKYVLSGWHQYSANRSNWFAHVFLGILCTLSGWNKKELSWKLTLVPPGSFGFWRIFLWTKLMEKKNLWYTFYLNIYLNCINQCLKITIFIRSQLRLKHIWDFY